MGILYSIIVGGLAGWLAGKIKKGAGFGVLKNVLLGVVGGAVAHWVFNQLGIDIASGFIADLFVGVVGAILLLSVASLFKKKG